MKASTLRWLIVIALIVLWEALPRLGLIPELFLPALSSTKLASWNTTPTRFGSGAAIGAPLIRMVPEVCSRRPASIISKVDLPQPLGPTSTTKRPGLMSSETSASATTSVPEVRNTWPTFWIWIDPARLSRVTFASGCIAFPPIGPTR